MARAKPRSKRSSAKKTPATKKRAKATPPSRKAAKTAKRSGAPRGAKKAARAPGSARKSAKRATRSSASATPPAQTQGREEKGGNETPSGIGRRVAAGPQGEARHGGGRIEVRNVNVPGYRTTVDARKYTAMKKVLLSVLPKGEPGLTQSEMFSAVRGKLPEDVFPGQEKAEWWVKCVQLDLEARGEMQRSLGKPLRWRAVGT